MKRDEFLDNLEHSEFPVTQAPTAADTEAKARQAMARIYARRGGVLSTFGDSIERSTFDEPEEHLDVKRAPIASMWRTIRADLIAREALGINRLLVYLVLTALAAVAVIFRIESAAVRVDGEMLFAVAALLIGLAVLASVYVQASASADAVERMAKRRVATGK